MDYPLYVAWEHQTRGGWNWTIRTPARIVKINSKTITIEAQLKTGETALRRVKPENLHPLTEAERDHLLNECVVNKRRAWDEEENKFDVAYKELIERIPFNSAPQVYDDLAKEHAQTLEDITVFYSRLEEDIHESYKIGASGVVVPSAPQEQDEV